MTPQKMEVLEALKGNRDTIWGRIRREYYGDCRYDKNGNVTHRLEFVPVFEPLNIHNFFEHTPLDYYRYGEYPRYLSAIGQWTREIRKELPET